MDPLAIHIWGFLRRRCDVNIVYVCQNCSGFLRVPHGQPPGLHDLAGSEDADSPLYFLDCADMQAFRVHME